MVKRLAWHVSEFRHVASMIFLFGRCNHWMLVGLTTGQAARVTWLQLLWLLSPQWCLKGIVLWLFYIILLTCLFFFFQSYLLKDSQSDNHVAGIKDYNDTFSQTPSAGERAWMTWGYLVEAVGDEPGQEPQLKPGVLILEIAAAPLCLGQKSNWKKTAVQCGCDAVVLWKWRASRCFKCFFLEGSWRNPAWFWKKNHARISPTFSAGSKWGPRHLQNIPHRRISWRAWRPRHGGWHETVTWYRWNPNCPNCSKPILLGKL